MLSLQENTKIWILGQLSWILKAFLETDYWKLHEKKVIMLFNQQENSGQSIKCRTLDRK